MEEWKQIQGFESYEVSTHGNVRSKRGLLKQRLCTSGRPQASLHKDGKQHQIFNHRLVANAFIPNPDNKPQIDHIDRNRTNNHISNLRWVTQSENQQNTTKKKHNTSGFKSVFKYEYVGTRTHTQKWFSSFSFNHQIFRSQFFDTPEQAYQWRCDKLTSFNHMA